MSDIETAMPSVDELEAKSVRLTGDVDEAKSALDVAKRTFADAAQADPTAVDSLLELGNATTAAKLAVTKAEAAVKTNQTAIEGIQYDERHAVVTEASVTIHDDVLPVAEAWFVDNVEVVEEFAIDTVTMTAKRSETGTITLDVKPSGEAMPKRPTAKRVTGSNGTRGKRSVTENGVTMTCREYVKLCGDEASPAAQADLEGTWEGSPVSYTNEAKRLAGKRNATFA